LRVFAGCIFYTKPAHSITKAPLSSLTSCCGRRRGGGGMGVFFTKPATVSPLAGTTPSLPKRFAIIGVWSQDANTRFSASWLASPRGPVATHYIGSGCKVVHAQPDEDTGSDCRCEPGKGDEFFFRLVQPPPPP
jgi:hypothetical protein